MCQGHLEDFRKHEAATLDLERCLVNVIVDEPAGMANRIPSIWEVADPASSVVRLHGRNHETWNKKGVASSAERFNYDYDRAELEEVASKINVMQDLVLAAA